MPLHRPALALLALVAAIPSAATAAPAPPAAPYECVVNCEIPTLTFRHYDFTADGGVTAIVRYSGENVSLAGVEAVAGSTLPSTRVDDALGTLRVRLEPVLVRRLRASGSAVVPVPLLAARIYRWTSTTEPLPAGQPVELADRVYAIGTLGVLLPAPPRPVAPTIMTTTAQLKRSRGSLVFVLRTDGAPGTIRLARSGGAATTARRRMVVRLRAAAARLALERGRFRVGLISERAGAERRVFRVDLVAPRPKPKPAPQPAAPAPSTGTAGGTPPSGSSDNCDPNYRPCIPNVAYDLDCPDIGITVQVIGTDHHRFDADNDGVGCETNS